MDNLNWVVFKFFEILSLIIVDDFIAKLWQVYTKALEQGYNQRINFVVIRSDYMLNNVKKNVNGTNGLSNGHATNGTNGHAVNGTNGHNGYDSVGQMRQVEINTISAGFAFVSTRMSQLHRYVFRLILRLN